MREELYWDCLSQAVAAETEIERAINFGGFDYIEAVQQKYGMEQFQKVLTNSRNLSRRAVNYWCLKLGIDRTATKTFSMQQPIWSPLR